MLSRYFKDNKMKERPSFRVTKTPSSRLQVLLVVFLAVAAVSGATTVKKKPLKDRSNPDEQENCSDLTTTTTTATPAGMPSTTKSKAHRAAFASSEQHIHKNTPGSLALSYRMQDSSLSDHAHQLFFNHDGESPNSFSFLVQLEEERLQQNNNAVSSTTATMKETAKISPYFASALGGSVMLAATSWFLDPVTTETLWEKSISKRLGTALAVAWLPLLWGHPARFAIIDLLLLVQVARQPAVISYFQKQVLPFVWKSLQTMIVTELWGRAWKWFFWQLEQLLQSLNDTLTNQQQQERQQQQQSSSSSLESKEQQMSSTYYFRFGFLEWPAQSAPPDWLVDMHSIIVGSVQKGVKSHFKKSIQETLVASFSVCTNALREQIWVP